MRNLKDMDSVQLLDYAKENNEIKEKVKSEILNRIGLTKGKEMYDLRKLQLEVSRLVL